MSSKAWAFLASAMLRVKSTVKVSSIAKSPMLKKVWSKMISGAEQNTPKTVLGGKAVAGVLANEMQGDGLPAIGMAVTVACHFLQDGGDRSEVGSVEGHAELAHPGLVAVGASQGEGDHGLVGHIVANGEGKGIV